MRRGAVGPDTVALCHQRHYALLGVPVAVASNSPAFMTALDQLNGEFQAYSGDGPALQYEVWDHYAGQLWELTCDGEELRWCDSLPAALSHVEWHIVDQTIHRRSDLVHVHGAVLGGAAGSVLLPGASGIGKTTFALALALRGLTLYADDVVFIQPDDWRPVPFPRSPHVHADALPRLQALGLRYRPEEHLGAYLCAAVFGPWPRQPGPPVRFIIFPQRDPDGPLRLEPLSQAEAAVRLMRYSKNLRAFPRFGLDLLPALMAGVECLALYRNDDLAAAADLVYRLVDGR